MINIYASFNKIDGIDFPDGAILFPEKDGINNSIEECKKIVESYEKGNGDVNIYTYSPYVVRAIECYCDVCKKFDELAVYLLDDKNWKPDKDITYSEYGMSYLYEKFSIPFDKLKDLLV